MPLVGWPKLLRDLVVGASVLVLVVFLAAR